MSEIPSSASFEVWGGKAFVAAVQPSGLSAAVSAVKTTVSQFDSACSHFREDSELSRVNGAAGQTVAISPLLRDALSAAIRAAQLTEGDVDPTVGAALVALGCNGAISASSGSRIVPVPGWRTIELDRGRSTVRLARGVRLDLGASAKALAADRAAAAACESARCGVLVGLGGDFSLAGDAPGEGWRVHVTDDHRAGPSAPGQSILLRSGGLASSSTTVRRRQGPSGPIHHLLDPHTAAPAGGVWRSATVAAACCLDANIASTAAIIRGERAAGWLSRLGLPARLVANDGTVVHVAGWPAAGEQLRPSAERERLLAGLAR